MATELNWVRAVHLAFVTIDGNFASLSALSNRLADNDVEGSGGTSTVTLVVKAEGTCLGSSVSLGGKGTHETLTVSVGSEDLSFGEKLSNIGGFRVSTIVFVLTLGHTTTVSELIVETADSNTVVTARALSSSIISAEFREFGLALRGHALTEEVVTTFTFTDVERFSLGVVDVVPTSTFQKSKSELRHLTIEDFRGSHEFVTEDSSFEVSTSTAAATFVFKRSTLDLVTTEMLLESAGKRLNVDHSHVFSFNDDILVGLTVGEKEVLVLNTTETKDVSQLVESSHDVRSVDKRVSAIIKFNMGKVEVDGRKSGSSRSTVESARSSSGNITFIGSVGNSN